MAKNPEREFKLTYYMLDNVSFNSTLVQSTTRALSAIHVSVRNMARKSGVSQQMHSSVDASHAMQTSIKTDNDVVKRVFLERMYD